MQIFYIPSDMKMAVQKNQLGGQILYKILDPSKKTASLITLSTKSESDKSSDETEMLQIALQAKVDEIGEVKLRIDTLNQHINNLAAENERQKCAAVEATETAKTLADTIVAKDDQISQVTIMKIDFFSEGSEIL